MVLLMPPTLMLALRQMVYLFQSPFGDVTVTIVEPSAGRAAEIFEITDFTLGRSANIRVKNPTLLAADDAYEYVVSCLVCFSCTVVENKSYFEMA